MNRPIPKYSVVTKTVKIFVYYPGCVFSIYIYILYPTHRSKNENEDRLYRTQTDLHSVSLILSRQALKIFIN